MGELKPGWRRVKLLVNGQPFVVIEAKAPVHRAVS